MNFKYLKNYLIVVFVFISSINFGQFSISGKIVDQDGEPLIGATVFIKKLVLVQLLIYMEYTKFKILKRDRIRLLILQ